MYALKFMWAVVVDFFSAKPALLLNQRRVGKFRILYPDGVLSQGFTYKVARDYQKIFGGRIILKQKRR